MSEIILEAKNIHKSYFNTEEIKVLQGIDLSIKKNESIAIMGESGEGKTTLLHILGLLEEKDIGTLKILNKKPSSSENLKKNIGFIFQSYNLLEDLSVLENVLMPAYIARKNISSNQEIYKKAENLIKDVGLEKRKKFLAKNLSGGERQRAAIARAFCNNPDLILADEPSGNLDNKNSILIHNLLIDFVKKTRKSLIVATHNHELASLCDKTYILKNGKFTNY